MKKKIIIISYYYPPSNFAGSHRVAAWVKHMPSFGLYPIVITRHWQENETRYTVPSEHTDIIEEIFDDHKVIRVPFKGTISDRIDAQFGKRTSWITKIFSFIQLVGKLYYIKLDPFRHLLYEARKVIAKEPNTEHLIVSGRPFILFKYGHLLKKKYPNLKWIADYRDPWNSNVLIRDSMNRRLLSWFELPMEKKWTANADMITSVSKGVLESIQHLFYQGKGLVVTNCFELQKFTNTSESQDIFTVAYLGSLYPSQHIELFLNAVREFEKANVQARFKILFIGTGNDLRQKRRINNGFSDLTHRFEFLPWMPKKEIGILLNSSSVLLICGIKHRKGTLTAKLFDYISFRKPIILCPSDNDAIDQFITDANNGVVCETAEAALESLNFFYGQWVKNGFVDFSANETVLNSYQCKSQVRYLVENLP